MPSFFNLVCNRNAKLSILWRERRRELSKRLVGLVDHTFEFPLKISPTGKVNAVGKRAIHSRVRIRIKPHNATDFNSLLLQRDVQPTPDQLHLNAECGFEDQGVY